MKITYHVPLSNHRCWQRHHPKPICDCYTDDEAAAPVPPLSREEEGVEALVGADCVWIGGGGGASATINPGVGIMYEIRSGAQSRGAGWTAPSARRSCCRSRRLTVTSY